MDEKNPSSAPSDGAPAEVADEAERPSQPSAEKELLLPDSGPSSWNPKNVLRMIGWAFAFGILADVVAKGLDAWYLAARVPGPVTWTLWYEAWMARVHPLMSALVSGGVASLSVFLAATVDPPAKIARLLWPFGDASRKWALIVAGWVWGAVISYAAWAGKGVFPGPLMLLGDVVGSRIGGRFAVPTLVWATGHYVRFHKGSRRIRRLRESLQREAARDVLVGANLFGLAAARFSARIFEKIGIRGEEELVELIARFADWLAHLIARFIDWLTHTGSL
jgi:hypothetical protein